MPTQEEREEYDRLQADQDNHKQDAELKSLEEKVDGLVKQLESEFLSGSEALFGFCAWLSSRKEKVVFSAESDMAGIPDLITEFCKINSLAEPRKGWEKSLTHPVSVK